MSTSDRRPAVTCTVTMKWLTVTATTMLLAFGDVRVV
jgi:hypothetical protein